MIDRGPTSGKTSPHAPGHQAMEAAVRETANGIADVIKGVLPNDYGFALLIFGLDGGPGRMNYISNARREDMVVALRELLDRMEGRRAD